MQNQVANSRRWIFIAYSLFSMLLYIQVLANSIESENKSKATQMSSLIVVIWVKIPSAVNLFSPWWVPSPVVAVVGVFTCPELLLAEVGALTRPESRSPLLAIDLLKPYNMDKLPKYAANSFARSQ